MGGLKKILVVSHERSGTHFLINTIEANCPGYDNHVISPTGTPEQLRSSLESYYGTEEPRIFKSHHQWLFFEPYWDELRKEFAIFWVHRNPFDVLVSSWLYHRFAGNEAFPDRARFDTWLRTPPSSFDFDAVYSLVRHENMVKRFAEHTKQWLAHLPEITMATTYERLSNGFGQVVGEIRSALGVSGSLPICRPELKSSPSVFPRKGKVGDWINHVSPEDQLYILDNL